MLRKLISWLTLEDYESAKHEATRRLVSRYARRNVRVQAGRYMSDAEFEAQIERGAESGARLEKIFC